MTRLQGLLMAALLVLLAVRPTWAADAPSQPALSDKEKMQKVEKMFDSPYSEEMFFRTDRLLLTSTGSMKPIYRAPSVANVITAEDMEKIGAKTLTEALEMVPGLHVGVSNKETMSPIFSIRGIHTSVNPQVLIMINGIPISNIFSGHRPLLHMPIAGISRIEVIRGPGSAVHGADAFSGTINILTKDGKDLEGIVAGASAGSFDTYHAWAQTGSTRGPFEYFLNLEYMKTAGDKDRIVDADMLKTLGLTSSLAPGALDTSQEVFNANLGIMAGHWTMRIWGIMQEDGIGDGVTNNVSSTGNAKINQCLADLLYRNDKLIKDLDINLRLYFMYMKVDSFLQLFPAGTVLPIDNNDGNFFTGNPLDPANFAKYSLVNFSQGAFGEPIQKDKQSGIDLTTLYEGLREHRFRLGTGFKYLREDFEEYKNFGPGVIDGATLAPLPTLNNQNGTMTDVSGTRNSFMDNLVRKLWYVSLQDEWSFTKKWELTAGVRYDHYSDFGDTINPRIALVWDTRYDLTTKLLYGKAFRPPSTNELFVKNNPSNQGNPNLKPETIQTTELAFDYQPLKSLRGVFNLFYYEVKDLIELKRDPGATSQTAQNTKDQNGYGFEFETNWEITKDLSLKGAVAYQRSRDKDTKAPTADAPRQQYLLNPRWQFLPGWSFDSQLYVIADRPRAAGDTRPEINNYELVNVILRKKDIIKHWDLALAVKNLFNEDVREPATSFIPNDYPMEGRSFRSEIQAHF